MHSVCQTHKHTGVNEEESKTRKDQWIFFSM